jgi:hypothetical protein
LKSGEGYKLELKSAELLSLIQQLEPLYSLHHQKGVPRGRNKFVQLTPQLEQLSQLADGEIKTFLNSNSKIGGSLLVKLLNWALSTDDPSILIERLVELNPDSFEKLNAAIGLQSLKRAISIWESNADNSDEEFWQQTLTEHSYVLEQAFSWPTSVVNGKAFVGGKNVFNKEGNIVDFLVRNSLTNNAALIEIKTPLTPLLGREYRSGIYNVSNELSGAIMQTLNYKHSLQEDYLTLTSGHRDLFDSFNPQCAVVIGNSGSECDHQNKTKSFELYRHQLPGVSIITFDELFDRTRKLIEVLEGSNESPQEFNDDIPF